ncbi:aspartate carbamoyltransferase [Ramlibacter sp. AN1133]|uniref:aspartate carbamoyltransferase n=1 Tax=Ramlibacter sp. AN1133 TaxID=3133429 RepID=UPI0030C59883
MKLTLVALAAALATGLACAQPATDHGAHQHADHAQHMAQRQAEVSQRGKDVMPFDLAATQHVFTKTKDGGVQQVLARRGKDREQVRLVREHLKDIHARFRQGDFAGPAHIHGHDMPGLHELQAAPPGAVRIAYRQLPAGAELVFTSKDRKLVAAIHRWFDAQVADHGHDAMAGHAHGHR